MNTLCENLRRLRLQKGYTQERVAEALGVSSQSVSRWECGNSMPDVMLLPEISKLYGATVDDLFREEIRAYPNYAQRLLSVYEASGRTEDFLAAEQEFAGLMLREHTADDLRCYGVLYHYMLRKCKVCAEELFDAAIEAVDKTHWVYSSACQQRIALMCELGRGQEEAKRWDLERQKNPGDPSLWVFGVTVYEFAGQLEKAWELVQSAIGLFPNHPALQMHAGDICCRLGRSEEAFAYWQRVRELDSTYKDAAYAMAFCYEKQGRYSQAIQAWEGLRRELAEEGLVYECQLPAEHIKLCREKLNT